MYFSDYFTIDRHEYNKTFKDFLDISKHYIKRYKNNKDVVITVYKNDKSYGLKFQALGRLKFY